jgi:hypothetical protein
MNFNVRTCFHTIFLYTPVHNKEIADVEFRDDDDDDDDDDNGDDKNYHNYRAAKNFLLFCN